MKVWYNIITVKGNEIPNIKKWKRYSIMKRNLKISASSTPAYIAITILVLIVAIILNFLFYFLCSALGIWVISLCFGFTFKWIYAVGAGIALLILSGLLNSSKSWKQLFYWAVLTKRKEVCYENKYNWENFWMSLL